MNKDEVIAEIEEICAHRIGNPQIKGNWLVWDCYKSGQTMSKFVSRVRKAGYKPFCSGDKFGVRWDGQEVE